MRPPIEYTVDDEPHTTTDPTLTPNQILAAAGIDATQYYLVLVHNAQNQESFRDQGDATIHMHPHMRFVSVFMGATPVS